MAKRRKREHDFSVTAFRVVQEATGETEQANKEKKFDPVALGHLGGLKGGKARAEKLTPEQRSEIAKKAAKARWSKE
ncbi:MAG: histone H1 [Chloroflexi bacterium]|nr:histone H1 [Chloroflexota bacterium]